VRSHSCLQAWRDKCGFCLGVSSCFLVVFVFALLHTLVYYTPLTTLQEAESASAQFDMALTPKLVRGSVDAIMYGALKSTMMSNGLGLRFNHSAGRISLPAILSLAENSPLNLTLEVQLINSADESWMGLGRTWPFPACPADQIYIRKEAARRLNCTNGTGINLKIDDEDWRSLAGRVMYADDYTHLSLTDWQSNETVKEAQEIQGLVVGAVFDDNAGKFPSESDGIAVVEASSFLEYVLLNAPAYRGRLPDSGTGSASDLAKRVSALPDVVMVNLEPPRQVKYIGADYDEIQRLITRYYSDLLFLIGFPQFDYTMPLLQAMRSARFNTLFLGLMLNMFIIILVVLSIVLIYSLLLTSVETRRLEMGILRTIGINRRIIIQLIFSQAFSYSIPAWIFGLALAQTVATSALTNLQNATGVDIEAGLRAESVVYASLLIFIIPVVSTYLPARKALGANLAEAMNTSRAATTAVKVDIERGDNKSVDWPLVLVAAALTIFGFCIYYLFPLALLSFDLALLLGIFMGVLMGMLIGLVMLSLNLELFVERIVVFVFVGVLCCAKPAVKSLVLKNLVAHRIRNRKTTIMYALSLGFIIFLRSVLQINIQGSVYTAEARRGVAIQVDLGVGVNQALIADLERYCTDSENIEDWAWSSKPLRSVKYPEPSNSRMANYNVSKLTNLGRSSMHFSDVIAVSPNFLDVVYPGYLRVSEEYLPDANLSLFQKLYSAQGSGSGLVATIYKAEAGIGVLGGTGPDGKPSVPGMIEAAYLPDASGLGAIYRYGMVSVMAFVSTLPGFRFSSFYTGLGRSPTLVSFPTFLRMAGGDIPGGVRGIPLERMWVRTKPGLDEQTQVDLRGDLIARAPGGQVRDLVERRRSLARTILILNYIFNFALVVVMGLCFFSVASSMATNIHEQTKEISILRAMGMKNRDLMTVYTREAFVLVFSASMMGLGIGTAVGWTVSLQRFLFTEIDTPFEFPLEPFLIILVLAFLSGLGASYVPAQSLLGMKIAKSFRIAT